MEFLKKMADSFDRDFYIIVFAVIAAGALILSNAFVKDVERHFDSSKGKLKDSVYYKLDISYTLFITLTSIFPLLGMFGTVKALLEIDMTQDINVTQEGFFSALTSTAWGIIFAAFFKIINAFVQPKIENMITKAKSELHL